MACGTTNKVIYMHEAMATVTAISGRAQPCDASGDLRILKTNDTLLEGETFGGVQKESHSQY